MPKIYLVIFFLKSNIPLKSNKILQNQNLGTRILNFIFILGSYLDKFFFKKYLKFISIEEFIFINQIPKKAEF